MQNCIFCKIIRGDIPSHKVFEDDKICAFLDINPQAPVHIVVIPKEHIESMDSIDTSNSVFVSYIFEKIPQIAKSAELSGGYRVISNCGPDACQMVKHLHFHILGGKQLSERLD